MDAADHILQPEEVDGIARHTNRKLRIFVWQFHLCAENTIEVHVVDMVSIYFCRFWNYP